MQEDSYETLWGYDETAKDCMKRNTKEGILEVHWTTGSRMNEAAPAGQVTFPITEVTFV